MPDAADTKTIPEYLHENPNVDNTNVFDELWGVLSGIKEKICSRFPVQRHTSCDGREYYQEGPWEGSLNTYTGKEIEWLVHSWIGNRKQSILDMNVNIWLGPHIDAPHLSIVFGTIPQVFHYSDLIPRTDLAANADYVKKYYEPFNQEFLQLRGDERFQASVSHGAYCRSVLSPIGDSLTAKPEVPVSEVIERLKEHVNAKVDYWLDLVDNATAVPIERQVDLTSRDHTIRKNIYLLDPMNELAKSFLGESLTNQLIELRYGKQQMAETLN